MPKFWPPEQPPPLAEGRLEQVARLLGCPVEAFSDEPETAQTLAEVAEMLTLFTAIDCPEDRQHLLALARAFVKARG